VITRRAMARNFVSHLGALPTDQLVQALAAEMVVTRRTHQMELMLSDIAAELLEQRDELYGTATSAHELTAQVARELAAHIQQLSGAKRVELTHQIDPELVGGVIVDTPTERYDWSVRHKLDTLKGVI
jgi:F-type H+-transporting ATPase subunit delta